MWTPAARPDVITADNAMTLKAKVVLQGANIPAAADGERILHERGIVSVPDFVANAGGVIAAAIEHAGGTAAEALAAISERVHDNTRQVLTSALERDVPPRAAAVEIARERVLEAMSYRRAS